MAKTTINGYEWNETKCTDAKDIEKLLLQKAYSDKEFKIVRFVDWTKNIVYWRKE